MLSDIFASGDIFVIDDKINEAEPLIRSLYKYELPHLYNDGSASSLPKKPKQVRLLFLDLNLKQGLNPNDIKSFKNTHAAILNRLLANKSSSYIILVWSKQESTFLDAFKEIFKSKTDEFGLNNRAPLDIISLEKNEYFTSQEVNGDIVYDFREEKDDELFKLIEDKLNENEPFRILSSWETLVKKSGGNVVNYLFELVLGNTRHTANKKLSNILSSLSISFLGLENFNKSSDQEKTDAFMLALSELIDDEIDKEIILFKQPEFTDWTTKRLTSKEKSQLNTKLLVSTDTSKQLITGSVLKGSAKHDYTSLLIDCIDIDRSAVKKIISKKVEEKGEELNTQETLALKKDLAKTIIDDNKRFIPIELNLTPLCDVVQGKEKYYRLVPGFLIKLKDCNYLYKNTDRNFLSPNLYSDNYIGEYILILDYRFLHSISKLEIEKMKKIFSLRKSFVDEIQLKLSNHVSRLGILYLS